MNLLEHMALHLESEGFGTVSTDEACGNIYWGILPDEDAAHMPVLAVLSVDSAYGGAAVGARLQIFSRGGIGDVRSPYEQACAIGESLAGFRGFLHGDGPNVMIEPINVAEGCGQDTRGRHYYVSNFRVYYCGI